MPELPEVETVRRILLPYCKGKRIEDVEVYRPKNVLCPMEVFLSSLKGKRILDVMRKGKVLCFVLEGNHCLYSHLRMEGRYFEGRKGQSQGKYEILRFDFDDGTILSYSDSRKFGRFLLLEGDPHREGSPFAELGPEPFDLDVKEFHSRLKGKSIPIKEALLDQSIVSGIGNIYADETLFACHIHPKTPAKAISFAECESIKAEASRILAEAIEEGGATIRSYHPKEGMDGRMQNQLLAYGNENKPCPRCGFPLRKIEVGGRGTTYCPICARSERVPFVIGVTGPIHSGKSTVSKRLEERGYARFDADAVAKSLYGRPAVRAYAKKVFGKEAIVDKKPNVPYLSKAMGEDKAKKKRFEDFLYPLVLEEARKFILKHKSVVLDVPLLLPSHIDSLCDVIILVEAAPEARANRLLEEGRDAKKLMKLNASYPLAMTKKKASIVIVNDGDLESLREQIDELPL